MIARHKPQQEAVKNSKSLLFHHLNYAKQVNKAGTGAFLYQTVKYGDIHNQQAAGEETESEEEGKQMKCFDLVPSKNSLS